MGTTKLRLSGMMLLQYAVWGFWLPVLGAYLRAAPENGGLGFSLGQVGWILGLAASSGAFIAPFVAGQFADRYFSAERFLAVLLVIGGVLQWVIAYQTSFLAWLVLSALYSICFQPTIALTNSIAFSHLRDPNNEFPYVRVWGTIGWIIASWVFPMVWLQSDLSFRLMPPFLVGPELTDATARLVDALKFSGTLAFFYAGFCFFLPHTPPKRDVQELAVTKAFKLLRRPSFAALIAASLPIAIIHQIYFVETGNFFIQELGLGSSDIGPAMTIGQFAEIFVMALLGTMLTVLGFRWTIFVGGMAYFLRYAIFGTVTLPVPIIVASQFLHGFCFACFFAAAFIYVDRIADDDIKHSAQTVFGIIILGVGPVFAGPVLQFLSQIFGGQDETLNYAGLWYTLAGIALVTSVGFAVFFRDETADDTVQREPEMVEEELLPGG